MNRQFQHGARVRDRVTKFRGIVIAYADYIAGGARYGVAATVDDSNKLEEERWFDETRLEMIEGATQELHALAQAPTDIEALRAENAMLKAENAALTRRLEEALELDGDGGGPAAVGEASDR